MATNEKNEKAADAKNKRTKVGVVVSNKMQKTVVVAVENLVKHGMYQKYIKRTNKFLAHNEAAEHQHRRSRGHRGDAPALQAQALERPRSARQGS